MKTENTTPNSRRYLVDLTITFSVEVEAESPEAAIEAAQECAISEGTPETVRETVVDPITYKTLLSR